MRPKGTGSIQIRHGRCYAYGPKIKDAAPVVVGDYDTRGQAERALEKWVLSNCEPLLWWQDVRRGEYVTLTVGTKLFEMMEAACKGKRAEWMRDAIKEKLER